MEYHKVMLAISVVLANHLPVVIYHGMGDDYDSPGMRRVASEIKNALGPETFVYRIKLGESTSQDRSLSYFDNVNRQITEVCAQLKEIEALHNGFNAIGFSQGGQFLRAYVERCNEPPVKRLITLGAQHQGVMALPGCPTNSDDCSWWNKLTKLGVFNPLIHHRVVQAQYYKSFAEMEKYLQVNDFLTDINNEFALNQSYKKNIQSLERFVMYIFENDTMVVPKESGWFGYYDGVQLQSLQDQDIYLQDRLGLRQLDNEDRLFFGMVKNADHLQMPPDFIKNLVQTWF